MALTFARPRLMQWDGNSITDHNRAELEISNERIERKDRMANGTMRKFVVADKRTFSTSWEMLPKISAQTADGFWGGQAIEDFFYATPGAFSLDIWDGDGAHKTYTVMFSDFSKSITKRGSVDLWTINVTMEEV